MTKIEDIVLVNSDDWQGIYIKGKLVYENHSISCQEFIKHAGLECGYRTADEEFVAEQGGLPQDLEEVKLIDD